MQIDIPSSKKPALQHAYEMKLNSNNNEIPSQQATEPIILDIGGIKYKTSKLTLSCDTNSILYKMFDGRFLVQPNKDGSYFIDRDGTNFGYILNYLRNNKLNIRNDIYLIDHLISESEYYQLSSLKSSLLLKKSNSKILKKGDTEFIQKCFDEDPKIGTANIQKSNLIYEGRGFPDYEKLKGLDCLLVLVLSKRDRFGIYIEDNYVYHESEGINGKLLDFDSEISGQRCIHSQHKGGVDQNIWVFIQNVSEIDPDAECKYEVELQVVIPDETGWEDWTVALEIGGTRKCTSYNYSINESAADSKPVSYIEIYQIGL